MSVARSGSGSFACLRSAQLLARALAVLEQSDLLQVARLAGLDELDAADAADLLATVGIFEFGRPLTFVHPLVRNAIYAELSSAERAQGHRRAARAARRATRHVTRHVAEHLLASEPAGDGWVVERLVAAARAAGNQGAPESEAVFLRRALAEPPAQADGWALLLELGMAEASSGLAGWPEHLRRAVDVAADPVEAAEAALVLATRAQPARSATPRSSRRSTVQRQHSVDSDPTSHFNSRRPP